MTTRTREPGEFCWVNMLTPQPDKAREFFAELLGWTYVELPGMGHRVQVGGRDIGGLYDLDGPNTPKGTPPLIGVMVKVASADSIAAKAPALGGKALPAFDVMDQGRIAVCFDPDGANIDVWEPKQSAGTDVDADAPGAPSWFETTAPDVGRASAFYSGLFGWTAEAARPAGGGYVTMKHEDRRVAGLAPADSSAAKAPPQWATYFTVHDVDATARKAVGLGATLFAPVRDVPGLGRTCGITSPQGVPFHVIQYAR